MNRPVLHALKQFSFPCRVLLASAICFTPSVSLAADTTAHQIDDLTRQWLQTEQQTTRLITRWQEEKPLAEQRLELLRAEKEQLTNMLERRDQKGDEVDQKREELLQQQSELEAEQAGTEALISALAARLDAFKPMLPPPLQSTWDSAAGEDSSNQLRLQLARLSSLKEFNERVTLHSMRLTPDEATDSVLVRQVYLGASQAWFSSADGTYTGTGSVEDGQWVWRFRDDIDSDAVLRAIAVAEKQVPAAIVPLPFTSVSAKGAVQP